MALKTHKTEHAGAKNGGGHWGKRAEAKEHSNRLRRVADKHHALVEPAIDFAIECAESAAERYFKLGAYAMAVGVCRNAISTYGGYKEAKLQDILRRSLRELGYEEDQPDDGAYSLDGSARFTFWCKGGYAITAVDEPLVVVAGLPHAGETTQVLLEGDTFYVEDVCRIALRASASGARFELERA
ncbi:MAG TPA: hypothetical protein VFQ76_01785 [Longimicrobiaceae bacterium]|nr:hypothetical protein [Longimicrobiaceae bacterium]